MSLTSSISSESASPAAIQTTPKVELAFSVTSLPLEAQALIAQILFNKETPRELRSLGGRHIAEVVVPKAVRSGMDVSSEEEQRATAILEKYRRVILAEVVQRILVPPQDPEEEVALYLSRFQTTGACDDRQALINFYTDALTASNDIVTKSAIIANDTIERILKEMHKVAPHNLHNILLICDPNRRELIASFDRFFLEMSRLTQPHLTDLYHLITEGKAPTEKNEVVDELAQKWKDYFGKAGVTMKREQWKRFEKYLEDQNISTHPVFKAPQLNSPLFNAIKNDLLPILVPSVGIAAKNLFCRIPASLLNSPEQWEGHLNETTEINDATKKVDAYLSALPSPKVQAERKKLLCELTDCLMSPVPEQTIAAPILGGRPFPEEKKLSLLYYYPVLQRQPALIQYLRPMIQKCIVEILDQKLLPHML